MLCVRLRDGTRRQRDIVSLRIVLVDDEGVFRVGHGRFLRCQCRWSLEAFRLTENLVTCRVKYNRFVLRLLLNGRFRHIGRFVHGVVEGRGIVERVSLRFLVRGSRFRLIVRDAQLILLLLVVLDQFGTAENFFAFLRLFVY